MVAWFGPLSAIVLALQVAGGTSLLAHNSAQNWPADVPTAELLANARRSVATLGVYHGTLSRTERIRGKITGPDVADVWVRETPHAVRMTLISGSNEGRRFLYNEALRPGEMLVRKRFVSVWIDVDSWLIKRYSIHTLLDVGFGPLLQLITAELDRAQPFGGFRRTDEAPGQGPGGSSCLQFDAPPGAHGLYSKRTRLCFDPGLQLPVFIEIHDDAGFLSRHEWRDVVGHQRVDDRFFTPQGAGM
jgi:Protein of unknown function (DUF1571)